MEGGVHQVEPVEKVPGPGREEDDDENEDDRQKDFPHGEDRDQSFFQGTFIDESGFCHQFAFFSHYDALLCANSLVCFLRSLRVLRVSATRMMRPWTKVCQNTER